MGKLAELKGEWIDYQYKLEKVEEVKTPKSDLTSHTARRTFVVTALNEGVELDLIAQITSHSDVEVMRPYIASTRKGKQKVIDALDNALTHTRISTNNPSYVSYWRNLMKERIFLLKNAGSKDSNVTCFQTTL